MKEIDFLPEWYKQRQKMKRKQREYYIALGLIMAIMISWSLFANGRVAQARAKNIRLKNANKSQSNFQFEYAKAQSELALLQAKTKDLKSIETKVRISYLLAEISHLIDGRVVLSKIDISTEPFDGQKNTANTGALRTANIQNVNAEDEMVRFRVTIEGIASNPAEVAQLISKLEASDYFIQIIPGYSRNVTVKGYQGSEFEISCYLANYEIDG